MGEGPEPIADKHELVCVRRGARNMLLTTGVAAVAATGLFLIPA